MQLFNDEAPVGESINLFAESIQKSKPLFTGALNVEEAVQNIMFKMVGKNKKSSGMGLKLMNIIFEKTEE